MSYKETNITVQYGYQEAIMSLMRRYVERTFRSHYAPMAAGLVSHASKGCFL